MEGCDIILRLGERAADRNRGILRDRPGRAYLSTLPGTARAATRESKSRRLAQESLHRSANYCYAHVKSSRRLDRDRKTIRLGDFFAPCVLKGKQSHEGQTMHYEIQCLIQSANGNHSRDELLIEAGKDLESKLRKAGLGFIIEVRDIRAGKRLFRSIDAKNL